MQCKNCGQRLLDDAKRCPICKTEFTDEDRAAARAKTAESGGYRAQTRERVPFGREETDTEQRWSRPPFQPEDDTEQTEWERSREDSWKEADSTYAGSYDRVYGHTQGPQSGGAYRYSRNENPYESSQRVRGNGAIPCGIAAFITAFLAPYIGIGISLVGIVTAIRGINTPARNKAIAGLVISIIALLMSICMAILTHALAGKVDINMLLS